MARRWINDTFITLSGLERGVGREGISKAIEAMNRVASTTSDGESTSKADWDREIGTAIGAVDGAPYGPMFSARL